MGAPYDAVLVSALTSAVVALGIELVAKPRMDARKERILGDHRNRLGFEANLLKIMVISATWEQFEMPPDVSETSKQTLEDEQARVLRELDEMTQALMDDLGSYAGTYVGWRIPALGGSAPTLIAQYVFIMRGISMSDHSPNSKFHELHELAEALQTALFTRWHPVRRGKALGRLPGILEKHGAGASAQPRTDQAVGEL